MEIVFYLVPASLCLVALGLIGYSWAVRSGQFDDLETPRWRILADDAPRLNQRAATTKDNGESNG